jgi:kojibiose phosphorylase
MTRPAKMAPLSPAPACLVPDRSGWRITASSITPGSQAYWASVFTLGNGLLGVRGAPDEALPGSPSSPMTLMAEIYDRPTRLAGEPLKALRPSRLASLPHALPLRVRAGDTLLADPSIVPINETRTLDMRRGTLERTACFQGADGKRTRLVSRRLVSQARPHVVAIRYTLTPLNYSGLLTVESFIDSATGYPDGVVQTETLESGAAGSEMWVSVRTLQSGVTVAVAATHRFLSPSNGFRPFDKTGGVGTSLSFKAARGISYTLEKTVSLHSRLRGKAPLAAARAESDACPCFDELAREQADEWAAYWRKADIRIAGDRTAQMMARFFVFHLLQSASLTNPRLGLSASIPAKSLSGPGYNGHVFWDTEIYMLPFFSQQFPEVAESLLQYRHDRLGAAARHARKSGAEGARFPWESADTGLEECPKWIPRGGGYLRWKGGEQEVHITADVAMGYHQHIRATGRDALLHGPALDIAAGTARYWASVARKSKTGDSWQIRTIIGPDEYHSGVNNSVYTNAMAAWNLRWADELLDRCRTRHPDLYRRFKITHGITASEQKRWREIARHLQINFDPATGLYEEFDGYFRHPRQQIKQADVLLMLHLLPERSGPGVFLRNFNRYYPVTLHDSSLSPALHVLFSLDCGRPEKAYPYLRMTCDIDGKKRGATTDEGIHSASLGAGWMALVAGFGGVRVQADHLAINPRLPRHWKALAFSTLYRGLRLRFAITPTVLTIRAESGPHPVALEINGQKIMIRPGATLRRTGAWRIPETRLPPPPVGPIRAVLFDLDGVIVSTDEFHYQAWKNLADAKGIPFDRTINHQLRGVSRMESLQIILKKSKRIYSAAEQTALAEHKNDEYRKLLGKLTSRDILPGVLILIDQLRERGIRMAIGSSSRNAVPILERIGLADAFDVVVDGTHIKNSKPDPEVFLLAAKRLGIAPRHCLVVEDAAAGVEAARAAGMKCLAVGAAKGHPGADLSASSLLDADANKLLGLSSRQQPAAAQGRLNVKFA